MSAEIRGQRSEGRGQETLQRFYRGYKRGGLKPRSRTDYEIQLRHLQRYFDGWCAAQSASARPFTVEDLSATHVHGLRNYVLELGDSRSTADKARRVMVSLWNLAAEMELVAPPPRFKAFQKPKHEPTAWSFDEFECLLFGVSKLQGQVGPFPLADWFEAPVRLVYNSGLRLDTAMSMAWSWLDLEQKTLVVPPAFQKDDEGQTITLLDSVVDCLLTLQEEATSDLVFGDWPYDRTVIQWPALTQRLRQAVVYGGLRPSLDKVKGGVTGDLWHKLRRTFATLLYAQTGNIELVRDLLAHSDISVTRGYIDKSKIGRKMQAEILDDPAPHKLRIWRADEDAG